MSKRSIVTRKVLAGISVSARTESIVSASVSVVAGRRAEAAAAAERMNNIPRMNINMVDACEDQSSTDSSWSNVSIIFATLGCKKPNHRETRYVTNYLPKRGN